MPVYEYTALDISGKNTSGIVDAESAFAARQKLRASKIFPVSIKEASAASAGKEFNTFSLLRFFSRGIKPSKISMMTRHLATLVGAGFPLVSAIDTLIPQIGPYIFKKTLSNIKDSIIEGNSFANALSLYPEIFSDIYINMVRSGETSGTLEIVLERLADIAEKQQALRSQIKSALLYPVLMLIVGSVVLFFLLAYIVPNITSIFSDMNQILPAPTRFLIAFSDLFKRYWWVIFIIILVLTFALKSIKKTLKGSYFFDKSLLSFPLVGTLAKKLAVARFSRTLGSLLENGVPMLNALEIVKNIVGNIIISNAVGTAAKEVEGGQELGMALAESKVFPNLFTQIVQVGEQSGELETMLKKAADIYENEIELSVMNITSMLEPVMILIMGIIVAFIVISICLPIFEMNQLVV
ncbi:MAG: type II secretion system inner membrane protein GspF [Deltaproteobacteria bacterium]|nr:type II secretion system inner membrane protein GspF [Deltaproteobacteria bacterium]